MAPTVERRKRHKGRTQGACFLPWIFGADLWLICRSTVRTMGNSQAGLGVVDLYSLWRVAETEHNPKQKQSDYDREYFLHHEKIVVHRDNKKKKTCYNEEYSSRLCRQRHARTHENNYGKPENKANNTQYPNIPKNIFVAKKIFHSHALFHLAPASSKAKIAFLLAISQLCSVEHCLLWTTSFVKNTHSEYFSPVL